jgi:hypothetical protein
LIILSLTTSFLPQISQVIYFALENRRLKQEAETLALEAAEPEPEKVVEPIVDAKPTSENPADAFLDNIQNLIDSASSIIAPNNN